MSATESFIDTSVLLHILADGAKADRVQTLLEKPTVISVQVLNEFTAVARRKLGMPFPEIREVLQTVRSLCRTEPVTTQTHDQAVQLAQQYKFSFYDSAMIASALLAGCKAVYCEDLQHGQLIAGRLKIINPFLNK